MAENVLVSPGIAISETDLSAIPARPLVAGAAVVGPTVKGAVNVPRKVTSYRQYVQIFGDTFVPSGSTAPQEFLTSMAAKSYFEQGGQSLLVVRVASDTAFTPAKNTAIVAQNSGSAQDTGSAAPAPFELETLSVGENLNSVPTNVTASWTADGMPAAVGTSGSFKMGTKENFKFVISNIDKDYGTFSLVIRRGDDTDLDPVVLESYNKLSLDPNDPNYIARVIGDQKEVVSQDPATSDWYVEFQGNYPNKSAYVRVKTVNDLPNYLDNNGNPRPEYTGSLPADNQVGGFFTATGKSGICYTGSTEVTSSTALYFENLSTEVTAYNQGVLASDYDKAFSILCNTDEYDINIISAPGLLNQAKVSTLKSVAEERGDCIAVVDLTPYSASITDAVSAAQAQNSSYAAAYWPWVQMYSGTGKLVWCPASTVIPGVYAYNDMQAAPWYAPAGMMRGGVQGVVQTSKKLTKAMRDTLYLKNVNPIATLPSAGIVVYGQKTLQKKASALDRVNVRRLLIALKKRVKDIASQLLFEQNTTALQNSFRAQVDPYLASVVQRNGLYAYRIDMSGNTPDAVDRNEFRCSIAIQPTRAIEFVYIDFTVNASGVDFS